MRELEDFLPYVLPYAPGCPDPVAVHHLREAVIRWCERTRCWREVDEFPTVAEEIEVVCVPPYASLHEIEQARFDGCEIRPMAYQSIRHRDMPRRDDCDREREIPHGPPSAISQSSINSVSLYPPSRGKLWLSMLLKPAPNAEMVPDFIFDQWARHIGEGALSDILMLPEMPFANPQLAVVMAAKFEAAMNKNFRSFLRGQQRAPIRSRSQFV